MLERIEPLDFLADQYVICICEGTAEQVILETLLNYDCLTFGWDNLVDRQITRKRQASKIEGYYLNREFQRPVTILRILDSRSERFHLSRLYRARYGVYDVYTRPEIEMLMILAEDKRKGFQSSKLKPSEFAATLFPRQKIKSRMFLEDYYSDSGKLLQAIRMYAQDAGHKGEYTLYHLLKEEYRF